MFGVTPLHAALEGASSTAVHWTCLAFSRISSLGSFSTTARQPVLHLAVSVYSDLLLMWPSAASASPARACFSSSLYCIWTCLFYNSLCCLLTYLFAAACAATGRVCSPAFCAPLAMSVNNSWCYTWTCLSTKACAAPGMSVNSSLCCPLKLYVYSSLCCP